ncbi:MAG: potassium transporter TrkH [Oligosphaeraceae bacterium]|nr:potassium transporter TrkH [Oligosphaeraceae bacterium]
MSLCLSGKNTLLSMKNNVPEMRQAMLQGVLSVLLPFLLIPCEMCGLLADWRIYPVALAVSSAGLGMQVLFRRPQPGRWILGGALALLAGAVMPSLLQNPGLMLFWGTVVSGGFFYLLTGIIVNFRRYSLRAVRRRAQGALGGLLVCVALSPLLSADLFSLNLCFALSVSLALIFLVAWGIKATAGYLRWLVVFLAFCAGGILWYFFVLALTEIIIAVLAGLGLAVLTVFHRERGPGEQWWGGMLQHPARCLIVTFSLLIGFGTLLLRTSAASTKGIRIIDAAFTAVSGVCVTGLSVIDIGTALSGYGQFFLLLLIQLGGLGIMSVATLALHALGRVSLNQERLMYSISEPLEANVFDSLKLILKFTLVMELSGALILIFCFFQSGMRWPQAAWMGTFTAVSAFCNAGFFPGAANLATYPENHLLLHTVALLIVFGGMAPSVTMSLPRFCRGRQVPVSAYLTISTTLCLLFFGTVFLLCFEWNGIFSGLTWPQKLSHAWFQSVTARTAGFNTVPVAGIAVPGYLLLLLLMFIGGSFGGTAGGIKTNTFAVIVLSFRAAVTGRRSIILAGRRILPETVLQALAIVTAALLTLVLAILMLITTQDIPARDIIFEATSALATVGLSTGATAELDGIGKLIIMAVMFIGRIGPLTFFLLLSEDRKAREPGLPAAKVRLS